MIKEILDKHDQEDGVNPGTPTLEINPKTGLVTITNLLIDCEKDTYITAEFRGLRGSDDEFFNKIMDIPNGQGHWKLLAKLCTQWGNDESVTSTEFTSSKMPMSTLSWLRANVIMGHYFRIPGVN
jgi:hypothetical protein